jgi:hypothetical protein
LKSGDGNTIATDSEESLGQRPADQTSSIVAAARDRKNQICSIVSRARS